MRAFTPGENAALLVTPVLEGLFVVGALLSLPASTWAGTDRVTESSELGAFLVASPTPNFFVRGALGCFSAPVSVSADRLGATSEKAAFLVAHWPASASVASELLLIGCATPGHPACVRPRSDGMRSLSQVRALLVAPVSEPLLVAGTLHRHSTSASIPTERLFTSSGRVATCIAFSSELFLTQAATANSHCSPAAIRLGSDFSLDRKFRGLERKLSG
jgi:hypothetical protein